MKLKAQTIYKVSCVLGLAIALSACASLPSPFSTDSQVTVIDQQNGDNPAVAVKMKSKDYRKLMSITKAEETNQKYYEMKTAMYNKASADSVPLLAAIEGLKNESGPTTYNDVLINGQNTTSAIVKTLTGGVIDLGKVGGAAYVGGKAVENRDATVVEQPQPLVVEQPEPVIVEPTVVEPVIVDPIVIPGS